MNEQAKRRNRDWNLSSRGFQLRRSERGTTMLELLIAIVILFTITTVAVISMQTPLQTMRSDAAMREVLDQLRQAREFSIVNRRYVQVTFPKSASGQPEVVITERNTLTTTQNAGADVVLSTTPLEAPLAFLLETGMPDTPDGFGNAYAVEFEGLNGLPLSGILFQSDGEMVDGGTYLPVSGTVFLGVAGNKASARAITVLGTTGRVRGWKSNGIGWLQF
jgi:Tfp pilus assembly protein PilE